MSKDCFLLTYNICIDGTSFLDVADIPGLRHRIGPDERGQSSSADGP